MRTNRQKAFVAAVVPTESKTILIDAVTLEIERADALTGFLAQQLSDLEDQPNAPAELYALRLIAEHIVTKLQLIHDKACACALHDDQEKTRKTGAR